MMSNHRLNNQGFALVGVIFLLVVLTFLGGVLVTLSGVKTHTVSMAVSGTQCYQAAKAGTEWGIRQALNGNCAAINGANWSLNTFDVSLTCTHTPYTEGTQLYNVYRIVAFADRGAYGDVDHVSRQVEVKVTDAPL